MIAGGAAMRRRISGVPITTGIALCLLAAVCEVHAAVETIRAEGFARGSGPQVRLQAQNAAIDEAIHLWVRGLAGDVPRHVVEPLFELRDRYVQSSRLIRQQPEQGGLRVEAEVYLETESLRIDAARAIFPHLEYTPKVLIVITEQYPDEGRPEVRMDGAVARQIRQVCTEQGLYVLPPEEVLALYAPNELRGYVQGGADRMALLARECLADVAIFGSASSTRSPAGDAHNTPRFQAQVELKSVGAHQGYVSEWASAEAALNGIDARSATEFAFRDAAFKIQRHLLAAAILTAYTQERRGGILLTVDEVPGTGWADQLRRAVSALPGVGRVEVLRAKTGTCRYELQLDGHIADVAKSIGAIELGGMRLQMTNALPDALQYRLVRPAGNF